MRVVLSLGRRAIDLAVLFLALYALVFVQLGHRTGLQHLQAIFGTRAARDAGHDLEQATSASGTVCSTEQAAPAASPPYVLPPRHGTIALAAAMPGAFRSRTQHRRQQLDGLASARAAAFAEGFSQTNFAESSGRSCLGAKAAAIRDLYVLGTGAGGGVQSRGELPEGA
jgi:hypothetical protein